jgi:hypothetical protein
MGLFLFRPQTIFSFAGAVLAVDNTVTHLFRELTRFLPDQDTVTEVLIVLGIVIMIFLFSRTDNLQSITRQVSPYPSEASPAITQK